MSFPFPFHLYEQSSSLVNRYPLSLTLPHHPTSLTPAALSKTHSAGHLMDFPRLLYSTFSFSPLFLLTYSPLVLLLPFLSYSIFPPFPGFSPFPSLPLMKDNLTSPQYISCQLHQRKIKEKFTATSQKLKLKHLIILMCVPTSVHG